MNRIACLWMPLSAILVVNVFSNVQAQRGRGPPNSRSCALLEDEINNDVTGNFTSPDYPNDYKNDYFEQFLILGSAGQNRITLTIDDFELESSNNCVYDYLQISDLTGQIPPTKYCGTDIGDTLTFDTNNLLLEFDTDSSITKRGFNISYTISTNYVIMREYRNRPSETH